MTAHHLYPRSLPVPPIDDCDPIQDAKHAREAAATAATLDHPPPSEKRLAVGAALMRLGEASGRLILTQNAVATAILRQPPGVDVSDLEEADELLRDTGAKLAAVGQKIRRFAQS